ncbi:uncharacterized protein [Macrobrachium rosenbergii]|uniref:uncharacterized protein n=1 Tax=Macrobrachium rosenbergii TaxID=79674 RepID=UPI0034D6DBAF
MNRKDANLVLRGRIVTLRNNGLSIRAIARDVGVSPTTVLLWIRRWEESGNLNDLPRPGGPRKTTPAEDDAIVRAAREQPLTNAMVIREDLGLEVSSMTVRRRLHAAGIHHRTPATKELLTERHKAGRYESCNIVKVVRSSHVTCNIWGWVCLHGMGDVFRIEGRFTAEWFARQDNLLVLEWPSKGTDMNVIEHVWAHMVNTWKMEHERTTPQLMAHINAQPVSHYASSLLRRNRMRHLRITCILSHISGEVAQSIPSS